MDSGQIPSAISGILRRVADPTARVLALLSLLESRRYWQGAELAERLGVSDRTLRRDVDRLRDLGYPVDAARGVGGGYQLAAGAALPPLVLDDDEAVALVVGLRAATDNEVGGVAESSVRALAKTLSLLPPRLRRRADALRAATVFTAWHDTAQAIPRDVLDVVAGACHDGVRLAFSYTARDGASTDRYVEPYRLVVLSRRWYLLSYDLDRDDWRTFRLDRMDEPRATAAPFTPRELPADPGSFVRDAIEQVPRGHAVVVDVQTDVATVEARIGRWATAEATGTGSCRVRMAADELEWPAFALMLLGVEFTVREPDELAAYVADVGRRFSTAGVARQVPARRATTGAKVSKLSSPKTT
jgi:predicted DNA-binding transcriptional regulator YafY